MINKSLATGMRMVANSVSQQMKVFSVSGYRAMSVDGVAAFKERETAAENLYFSKEEERLLRNLLVKMKSQADKHDKEAESHNSEEVSKLQAIISKYNMSKEDAEGAQLRLLELNNFLF